MAYREHTTLGSSGSELVTPIPHNTGNATPYNFTHEAYTASSEEITDVSFKQLSKGYGSWKSCEHIRVTTYPTYNQMQFETNVGSSWWDWRTRISTVYLDSSLLFGPWYWPNLGLPSLYVSVGGKNKVVLPAETENLIEDSLQAMLPRIQPKLSLLNTIYELKDFKSLPRTLVKVEKAIEALRLFGKFTSRGSKRLTLKQIAKSVVRSSSDAYLQSQFNIVPLLADIQGLYNTLRFVEKEIERLLQNEGKRRIARFAVPLTSSYPDASELSPTTSLPNLSSLRQSGRVTQYDVQPMFRAQMAYTYRFTSYQRMHASSLGALDALGFGGALRTNILWNAIPYSFILDWVLGVNQWLKRNVDQGGLEPITTIHRYLYSFTAGRIIMLSNNLRVNATHLGVGPMVPCSVMRESVYIRQPHVPDLYSSIRTSGLNLKEFSLAGAMAVSPLTSKHA